MADRPGSSDTEINKNADIPTPLPTNEEVIEDLVKGIGVSSLDSSPNVRTVAAGDKIDSEGAAVKDGCIPDDFEKDDNESPPAPKDDDYVDEDVMKDAELEYSDTDRERLRLEADALKAAGNEFFKANEYTKSAEKYTLALRTCSLAFPKDRAVLYSNRAAAKMKLGLQKSAIEDCSKAVEFDPIYLKAFFRRAQLYQETDKLDEALADYKKILELDPEHRDAMKAVHTLPEQIQIRNEKMKDEMLAKLKDLGNLILRPFGLSTNNFQLNPSEGGGYSVNFQQNKS